MSLPQPTKANFNEAVTIIRNVLEGTEFAFAGFALLTTESYSQWSLSLTTDKYVYEPCFCVAVGLDIDDILKENDIHNVEIINTEVMYTELPVSNQSLDRFQVRLGITNKQMLKMNFIPGEREAIQASLSKPPTTFKKRAKFPKSNQEGNSKLRSCNFEFSATFSEKDHCSAEGDLGLDAKSVSVQDDNISVSSNTPSFAKGINFEDFKASKFLEENEILADNASVTSNSFNTIDSYEEKSNYYKNLYLTLKNVKSIDKDELLTYASRKKINLYFTLIRKHQRLESLTKRERILRSSRKIADRLLSFVLSGNLRPWNVEYHDNIEYCFKDAIFEHIVEENGRQLNLSLLRAVTILSNNHSTLQLKPNKFKILKQLSYNYLINTKIKLKTDLGDLSFSEFQRLLEEHLNVPHNYCLYARELDSRIGYGRRIHPNVNKFKT